MKRIVCGLLVSLAAAPVLATMSAHAHAQERVPVVKLLPQREVPPAIQVVQGEPFVEEATSAHCFPAQVLEGARVAILGAYEGRSKLPFLFQGDSHEVTAIRVGANTAGPPLLLVLTAYDPVIWDLAGVPAGRLRGVLVYGYHGQGVAHLPARVPLRFETFHGRERHSGCGEYAYAYKGGGDLDRLVDQVAALLGREPGSFTGDYSPLGLHVERGVTDEPVKRIDLSRTRLSMPIDRSLVAPGAAGLDQLLASGAIRRATADDVARVNEEASRRSRSGHLAPFRHEQLGTSRTYVVTRAITVPAGMYGGNSASFIIMPGVPTPIDRGSHNTYYSAEDGSCRGC